MKRIFIIIVPILFLWGCGEIKTVFKKPAPYDEYKESLEKAGLINTALGTEWLKAGEAALQDSSIIELPHREKGYFPANKIRTSVVRFQANRGELLTFQIITDTTEHFEIFSDLFFIKNDLMPEYKKAAYKEKLTNSFNYQVDENGIYLLRLQPELLKGGSYQLIIKKSPSVAFPVAGTDSKAIRSFWGDSRDGGRREHKGVDIFAPKRTPVTAATDGIITRTGSNRLGGKVVWLSTGKMNFYYAHLDSQIVSAGSIVETGDTLGLVGNTGNARNTPPHLHFGIYIPGEGAINPYPFVKNDYENPSELKKTLFNPGELVRVKSNTTLKLNPEKSSLNITQLKKNTPLEILKQTKEHYQVLLPDNITGYIPQSVISSLNDVITRKIFDSGEQIMDSVQQNSNIMLTLDQGKTLPVYGIYNGYYLVQVNNDFGWVEI